MAKKNSMPLWAWILIWLASITEIAWGLYGAFNKFNLVEWLFQWYPLAGRLFFILVGIAGLGTIIWSIVTGKIKK